MPTADAAHRYARVIVRLTYRWSPSPERIQYSSNVSSNARSPGSGTTRAGNKVRRS
jgi:hypothetical protein